MSTLAADVLFSHLQATPDEVAFIQPGRAITYGELDRRARGYAAALRELGFERGDRIAAHVDGSIDMVVALLGHYMAGCAHVPINTRYGAREIEHILNDSGAKGLVHESDGPLSETLGTVDVPDSVEHRIVFGLDADPAHHDEAHHDEAHHDEKHRFGELTAHEPLGGPIDVADSDLALLIYTSGTTGQSKGVQLTHRAVVTNIDALTRLWQWTPDDVLVLALPLFHVHGLCIGIHGTLIRGCRSVIHERFSAGEVIYEMGQGGSIFMGVPTMYAKIVETLDAHPERADWLKEARLFTSGSAALSPNVFERFEAHTGHRILERYGMSETLLTLSNPYLEERRPGTVGKPVPGCEVRVVDDAMNDVEPGEVGQIVVRGPTVMDGYRGLPEKTAAAFRDGWFLTGDVATISADGYVSIVGRQSVDIIKSGGYKISAREIEEVLERHPSVTAVAVVGIPDDTWGERIGAAVVLAEGATSHDLLDELADFCAGTIADYKRVRDLIVVDEIPRNALGKVQKHKVVELFD